MYDESPFIFFDSCELCSSSSPRLVFALLSSSPSSSLPNSICVVSKKERRRKEIEEDEVNREVRGKGE